MKPTDYPILLTWSADDDAYLAQVFGLPGCVADGKTQEEAVHNALLSIEEWLETAQELKRPVAPPPSHLECEAFCTEQAHESQRQFQVAVEKAVTEALENIVPRIAAQLGAAFASQGFWHQPPSFGGNGGIPAERLRAVTQGLGESRLGSASGLLASIQ